MPKVLAAIWLLYSLSGASPEPPGSPITSITGGAAFPEDGSSNEFSACQEFRVDDPVGSGWVLDDCIAVWRSWTGVMDGAIASKKEDRHFFFDISDRLRQQGTPCYVESPHDSDGAGSRTMRYLATWVYAQDMGCDCLLPKQYQPGTDGVLYCHRSKYIEDEDYRCSAVDWIGYFNLSDHLNPYPDDGQPTTYINARSISNLKEAVDRFLENGGFDDPPWVHWILRLGNSQPPGYFIMPDTWNEARLQRVRGTLKRLRTSFRWSARPMLQAERDCHFATSRPNIAIHVRLGDRDGHQGQTKLTKGMPVNHDDYFDKLDDFMDTVSAAALRQGGALPVFHIFSETSEPCPSTETGAFDEFLRWPVETDQVKPCVIAVTPDECWEKTQGAPSCPSPRSGVFLVERKPLYLHVGLDVANAMSCMIEADGILMGCSTFGEVAGVFSEGLRFFSVDCHGWLTPYNYRMVPPMAIAERGNMWVPLSGSWREPVIYSEGILNAGLSQLYEKLGSSD